MAVRIPVAVRLLVLLAALGAGSTAQTVHVVTQSGFNFTPAHITIDLGDTVRWTWGNGDHTVTEGPGPLPGANDAFDLALNGFVPTAEVIFDSILLAGWPRSDNVYQYYCIPHWGANMRGSVTVRERRGTFLDGAQETPPTGSAGQGSGQLSLNLVTNTLTWNIAFAGLSGPVTAAHMHGPAAAGQDAPPVVTLGTTSPLTGSAVLTAQQESDLLAGLWYVNLHTAAEPDGEIRGQIVTGSWVNLGGGTASVFGAPTLRGVGPLTGESLLWLDLRGARQNALMLLWLSLTSSPLNIFGGTIHAFPFTEQVLLATSPTGTFAGGTTIPPLPAGTNLWFQFLIDDPFANGDIAFSNAMRATSP